MKIVNCLLKILLLFVTMITPIDLSAASFLQKIQNRIKIEWNGLKKEWNDQGKCQNHAHDLLTMVGGSAPLLLVLNLNPRTRHTIPTKIFTVIYSGFGLLGLTLKYRAYSLKTL